MTSSAPMALRNFCLAGKFRARYDVFCVKFPKVGSDFKRVLKVVADADEADVVVVDPDAL